MAEEIKEKRPCSDCCFWMKFRSKSSDEAQCYQKSKENGSIVLTLSNSTCPKWESKHKLGESLPKPIKEVKGGWRG